MVLEYEQINHDTAIVESCRSYLDSSKGRGKKNQHRKHCCFNPIPMP